MTAGWLTQTDGSPDPSSSTEKALPSASMEALFEWRSCSTLEVVAQTQLEVGQDVTETKRPFDG